MKRGGGRGSGGRRIHAPRMAIEGFGMGMGMERRLVTSHRRMSRQCRIIVKRREDCDWYGGYGGLWRPERG